MTAQRIISADSHIQEPPELFSDWLPEKFRHKAPRIVERDGGRYLIVDGKRPRRLDIAEGRLEGDDDQREFRDGSTGRDIERRLADQARDGVHAEVIYPNSALSLYNSRDAGYQNAVAGAYNDWILDLFSGHGDRMAPVAIVPVSDIDAAVREVERVAKLGCRSVKIPISMRERPYNLPEYEPLWAALNDSGMVLSLHAFTESVDVYPEDWGEEDGIGGALNHMAMSMVEGQNPVSLLISSGVLMRHPDLRVVIVECGAGWLAWLLYVLDEQVEKKHMWIRPKLDLKPSEYFRRQCAVTFSDDPIALKYIEFTGAECLMWGSDYPHDEGTFPNSQAVIERIFAGVPPADKQMIIHDNAARLYGLA